MFGEVKFGYFLVFSFFFRALR